MLRVQYYFLTNPCINPQQKIVLHNLIVDKCWKVIDYMWCDLLKSVGTRTCDIFSFLFDWSAHLEKYILLKTPLELVQWFQGNEQLKDSQNNRKQ